jgi:hypothetical protein
LRFRPDWRHLCCHGAALEYTTGILVRPGHFKRYPILGNQARMRARSQTLDLAAPQDTRPRLAAAKVCHLIAELPGAGCPPPATAIEWCSAARVLMRGRTAICVSECRSLKAPKAGRRWNRRRQHHSQ